MPEGDKERGLVDDGLAGLTYQVIGLAISVHNDLGPGHREATYHNAMTQKYADAGLPAEFEPELAVFDEIGLRRAFDFQFRPAAFGMEADVSAKTDHGASEAEGR